MEILYRRDWLNEGEGTAFVMTSVDREEDENISAFVNIADCQRIVSLDFCSRGPEGAASRLRKVDLLVDVLREFREALVKAGGQDA